MVTNSSLGVQPPSKKRRKGKRGKPHATVKFGSAVVPIYKSQSGTRTRYTISYHRDGERIRQVFPTLDAAKKEARLVAQRIQSGTRIFGPYTGSLSNGVERLTLDDKNVVARSTVNFSDGRKWPAAADGAGHSLMVIDKDRLGCGRHRRARSRGQQ